jgi:hypothetical protein
MESRKLRESRILQMAGLPLRKKIKNLKKAGNKMAGSFVSSIVFP